MNDYPYPIPSSATPSAPQPDNYFYVGNDCCGGSLTKDVDASVKVYFDYTQQLPATVNVLFVDIVPSPADVTGIGVEVPHIDTNIASFLVNGGIVGAQYTIAATAQLSDGQVWIDSIRVNITDCDAIATPSVGLLNAPGVVDIAYTLYYVAVAGQTIFPLSTPDAFGQTGILAGSNVFVHVGGSRLAPILDYTVNTSSNEILLLEPATGSEEVIFDLLQVKVEIPDAPNDAVYGRQAPNWVPVLPLSGGTMTGPAILAADPIAPLGAATKQYADTKLSKTGGTMTGPITLSADPVSPLQPATKQYADTKLSLIGGTLTGSLTLAGDPISPLQAATKQYVDTGDAAGTTFANTKVAKSGDAMTGPLFLSGNPTASLGATPKQYVDNADSFNQSLALGRVAKTGDTMTGLLVLSGDPVSPPHAATKQYTDTKLALAGGTMTGAITLAANPTAPLHPATKQYVDAGSAGVITDAPIDVNYYSRHAGAWVISPGNFIDAPSDATLYARKSGAWTHVTHNDITDWSATIGTALGPYALISSVPVASGTTPIMDGTAAIGTGVTFARNDHVHPTDTTLLAKSGGTMTGAITLAADPAAALQPATKQYVDAGVSPIGSVTMFAGAAPPTNWVACDGTSYLRTGAMAALFGVIGTQFGAADGTHFNVPNIGGRFPVGVGTGYTAGSTGGEASHVLSAGEMPAHAHALSDPGHAHGTSDPTHNHGFNDPGHAHSVYDPTHNHGQSVHGHGISDPTHAHGASGSQDGHTHNVGNVMRFVGSGGSQGVTASPFNTANVTAASDGASANGVYVSVAGAATGVGVQAQYANINAAATGIGIYGSGTACYNSAAATSIAIAAHVTSITMANTGGGAAHENRPPYIALLFIIRYQ